MDSLVEPARKAGNVAGAAPYDVRCRRLRGEQALLRELAARNPGRLSNIVWRDTTVTLALHGTPALPAGALSTASADGGANKLLLQHVIRVTYPLFFPTLPLELFLDRPAAHPNIHPETGFVCLWQTHRVTGTIEHALHKLVAMLGWQLANAEAVHVMQPAALRQLGDAAEAARLRVLLRAQPLLGVEHPHGFETAVVAGERRKRLSSQSIADD